MASASRATAEEQTLLDGARSGDEGAFQRLIEAYRSELHAHCYRMLGSAHDADDALQETMLRAWRGLPRFEGRSSLRSWLYTIATNTCLNAIEKRPKRVLPVDYGPPADPHGGPRAPLGESGGGGAYSAQGFSAEETAASLETTVASVNSALQRARKTAQERLPEQSQQQTLRALGDQRVHEVVERYVDAWERCDVEAVVAMLAEEATFAMPPMSKWVWGSEDLRAFLAGGPMSGSW